MEKIKAVGYTRYSSSNQSELSTVAQKRFITAYCVQHNIELIRFYVDEERTGKNFDREGIQELLKDAKNGADFSAVICHKLDRFSRNVADTSHYIEELEKNNIALISVSENLDNTPSGIMLRNIMASFNEYYVRNLSLETKKGLREVALKCEFTGGIPPLGFDVLDKKLVINENEAKIVRTIFEMYSKGSGYNQVCKRLNSLGFKTKKGKAFGKNSIYSILRNEKYMGVYTYNKYSPRSFSSSSRNSHRKNKEEDIIRIKDGCPAIVSEELWNKCNHILNAGKQYGLNAKNKYLLTGKVFCRNCGCSCHGNHRNPRGDRKEYNTYRCGKKDIKCNTKEINAKALEDWVMQEIFNTFFSDDNIIEQIYNEVNQKLTDKLNNDIIYTQSKKQLASIKEVQQNLIEAIEQIGFSEIMSAKISQNEKMMKDLQEIIDTHDKMMKKSKISIDKIKAEINNLKQNIINPKSFEQLKYLISKIVDRIEIDNTTITMTYKLFLNDESDIAYIGNETIERETLINHTVDLGA